MFFFVNISGFIDWAMKNPGTAALTLGGIALGGFILLACVGYGQTPTKHDLEKKI